MSSPSIPVVIIGVHRETAVATAEVFSSTPYYVAAVLDLEESPKKYQYSTQNLGTVLHALHPRPRVLITGTAVEGIVVEVRKVWEKYINGIYRTEGAGNAVYVALSDFHSEDGPPPQGTVEYLMGELDAAFK